MFFLPLVWFDLVSEECAFLLFFRGMGYSSPGCP